MNCWSLPARHVSLGLVLLVAACSGETEQTADAPNTAAEVAAVEPIDERTEADATASSASDDLAALPVREGPRSQTTGGVPHIQTDAIPHPDIDAELRQRVFAIPGIEEGESALSLPGARSLLLPDDLELARPDVLPGGREFGHFHPDGSLHLWLPVDRALEVNETKWGELHPLVGRDNFWDGVVMIYVPESAAEADIALQLIIDAYSYIVGTQPGPASLD
ncbi:MAG: luciferase family protein [Acidimicrobiales bacterium]